MFDVRELLRLGVVKRFAIDEIFFFQGDPGEVMFILLSGRVSVTILSADGAALQIACLGPGDFFGEMSLLEQAPRSATVQAMEDCTVIELSQENFHYVVAQQPQFAYRLMKVLSTRIRRLDQELVALKNSQTPPPATCPEQEELADEQVNALPAGILELKNHLLENAERIMAHVAPASHEQFVFPSHVTCPSCQQDRQVLMVRSSRLTTAHTEPDLRRRYQGFEPIWYSVWICSACAYADFHTDFKQFKQPIKTFITDHSRWLRSQFTLDFSEQRNAYEVIDAYLYLLLVYRVSQLGTMKEAILWLRLSWLFVDVTLGEQAAFAGEQALCCFRQADIHSTQAVSGEQEARLALIMGELAFRKGEEEEALQDFRRAIACKPKDKEVIHKAEARIYDIRRRRKKAGGT